MILEKRWCSYIHDTVCCNPNDNRMWDWSGGRRFNNCLSIALWPSSRATHINIEARFIEKNTILHGDHSHSSTKVARASIDLLLFLAAGWRVTTLMLRLHFSFINSAILAYSEAYLMYDLFFFWLEYSSRGLCFILHSIFEQFHSWCL